MQHSLVWVSLNSRAALTGVGGSFGAAWGGDFSLFFHITASSFFRGGGGLQNPQPRPSTTWWLLTFVGGLLVWADLLVQHSLDLLVLH